MLTRPLFFGYLSIATGWSSHFGSKFPNAQLMPSNKQLRVRVSHESRYIGTSHGQSTEWQGKKHRNRAFQMPDAGVSRWHLAKESQTKVSPFSSRFRVPCFLVDVFHPKPIWLEIEGNPSQIHSFIICRSLSLSLSLYIDIYICIYSLVNSKFFDMSIVSRHRTWKT